MLICSPIGLQYRDAAFGARHHQVLDAHVGERAAHHHPVVAAPRAVGVEILDCDAVLLQIQSGGRSRLDRARRADVVGRHRVAEDGERARALDVAEAARLHAEVVEVRRLLNVGRIACPTRRPRRCCTGSRSRADSARRSRCRAGGRSPGRAPRSITSPISSSVGQMSLQDKRPARPCPCRAARCVRSMSTRPASAKATTSGGDIRKLALTLWWTRASKLRLPDSTLAATRSLFVIDVFDARIERAGVADAGRAAVADEVEAELVEIGLQPVFSRYSVTTREPGASEVFTDGLHCQAAFNGLLRQQAGGQHDARVGGVGAGGDRRDHHVAMSEIDRRASGTRRGGISSDAVGRRAVVHHLDFGQRARVFRAGVHVFALGRAFPSSCSPPPASSGQPA